MTLKYSGFLGDPWDRKRRRDRRISDPQLLRRVGGADNWRGKHECQAYRRAKDFAYRRQEGCLIYFSYRCGLDSKREEFCLYFVSFMVQILIMPFIAAGVAGIGVDEQLLDGPLSLISPCW